MSDFAIHVENLSKRYKLGARRSKYDTLRDHLVDGVKSLFSRNGHPGSPDGSHPAPNGYIWALNDVSFQVKHGEAVGFVGRNGAGKSTLLKILSRVTEPTRGKVEIYGRIGSLLEVGTGFHPELTGRENIYLNGAILGMKKGEINRKFDEIVAFAEVEKFIDTPVKRYSSGMQVRLAFAVAAHLEPEILILDEVLAVGDAAFQLKCLDKMHEIQRQGRTILFVSHNMNAITRMCEQVHLVEKGRIARSGTPHEVLPTYLASTRSVSAQKEWDDLRSAPGNEVVRLRKVRVTGKEGQTIGGHDIRLPVGVEMEYEVLQAEHILIPAYYFFNEEGLLLFALQDVMSEWRRRARSVGRYMSTAWIPGNFLAEGGLTVDVAIVSHVPATAIHVMERRVIGFQVFDSHDGDSARGDYKGPFGGVVRPMVPWSTDFIEATEVKIQPNDRH